MTAELLTSILFATVVAGTPLVLVALGELVCEKSGMLNLGAEGMMALGAVAGFIATFLTGSVWAGGGGRHGRWGPAGADFRCHHNPADGKSSRHWSGRCNFWSGARGLYRQAF